MCFYCLFKLISTVESKLKLVKVKSDFAVAMNFDSDIDYSNLNINDEFDEANLLYKFSNDLLDFYNQFKLTLLLKKKILTEKNEEKISKLQNLEGRSQLNFRFKLVFFDEQYFNNDVVEHLSSREIYYNMLAECNIAADMIKEMEKLEKCNLFRLDEDKKLFLYIGRAINVKYKMNEI